MDERFQEEWVQDADPAGFWTWFSWEQGEGHCFRELIEVHA